MKPTVVANFNTYVGREKSFHRFLQHLYYSYPIHVVDRVFKYLFFTWEFYHPCAHFNLPVDRSLLISKHIADRIYKCESGLARKEEDDDGLRELIEGLTLAVVLVLAKIAVNPMLSRINNKRKQS